MVPASSSAAAPTESSGHSSSFGSPLEPPLLFVSSAVQRDALVLVRTRVLFARTRTRRPAPRREAPGVSCCLPSTSWWDCPTLLRGVNGGQRSTQFEVRKTAFSGAQPRKRGTPSVLPLQRCNNLTISIDLTLCFWQSQKLCD